jgi:hypothetical protein
LRRRGRRGYGGWSGGRWEEEGGNRKILLLPWIGLRQWRWIGSCGGGAIAMGSDSCFGESHRRRRWPEGTRFLRRLDGLAGRQQPRPVRTRPDPTVGPRPKGNGSWSKLGSKPRQGLKVFFYPTWKRERKPTEGAGAQTSSAGFVSCFV